jgi:hypothetical protein
VNNKNPARFGSRNSHATHAPRHLLVRPISILPSNGAFYAPHPMFATSSFSACNGGVGEYNASPSPEWDEERITLR